MFNYFNDILISCTYDWLMHTYALQSIQWPPHSHCCTLERTNVKVEWNKMKLPFWDWQKVLCLLGVHNYHSVLAKHQPMLIITQTMGNHQDHLIAMVNHVLSPLLSRNHPAVHGKNYGLWCRWWLRRLAQRRRSLCQALRGSGARRRLCLCDPKRMEENLEVLGRMGYGSIYI